jgi:DNA-binding NarL/FixJ family response regulator
MTARHARGTIAPMSRTIVIVDDHAAFRSAARSVLVAHGFDVVGEAVDGAQALRLVAELHPAVVLLDIALPDIDGFEVARRLARTPEPPDVVLISSRDRDSFGGRLKDAPVRGFLGKHELSGVALGRLLG